uniref:Intraflagellar transport protein 56 n=1 Tax=Ascaris lumbricoides TaxID=6252 RepID=A0A0M3I4P8_ASCLU
MLKLVEMSWQRKLLSRLRPAKKKTQEKVKRRKMPELEEFLVKRDYAGAISLLEFRQNEGHRDELTDLWLGHCAFHAGEYKKASEVYERMLKEKECPPEVNVYLGCAFFFLGMYLEAKEVAEKGPKSPLQNRLLFHVSHKLNDEKHLMQHHSHLQDTIEDQLSLASIHYLRLHYQEAIDIYKKILLNNRNFIALNVYLALCYYKLDYYDVSMEVLQIYLTQHPDSATAVNLRACNQYKLYHGKAAEKELRTLQDQTTSSFLFAKDLITHNTVVFRDGDAALQVLPSLIDTLPEARLNLIIFHLRRGLLVNKMSNALEENLDTIAGRQAMASAYFLMKQFEEVLVYLNSIKSYFYNDDTFNFNIGQALLACGNAIEAETSLLLVADAQLKKQLPWILCLIRAYCLNKKGNLAWEMYTKMKASDESFAVLRLIANDCYKVGDYFHSAKAFDAMERIEPNPEYWEGKRGAVIGVFKLVAEHSAPPEQLKEAMLLLEKSRHPQVEYIATVIRRFCRENNIGI